MDLFGQQSETKHIIELKDAQVEYYPYFFSDSKIKFTHLRDCVQWRQDQITVFGKTHAVPRLQAWYADTSVHYQYSGIKLKRHDWSEELVLLKKDIERLTGQYFNGCLCNLYRSGKDYAAWHADDEASLGKNPFIASASFGAERKFVMKHKFDKGVEKRELHLADGSLLIMKGPTQHFWLHQLNKTQRKVSERINLTFRNISN